MYHAIFVRNFTAKMIIKLNNNSKAFQQNLCMCVLCMHTFLAKRKTLCIVSISMVLFCIFQIFKVQLFVIIIFAKTSRVVFWLLAVNNRSMTIIIYTIHIYLYAPKLDKCLICFYFDYFCALPWVSSFIHEIKYTLYM